MRLKLSLLLLGFVLLAVAGCFQFPGQNEPVEEGAYLLSELGKIDPPRFNNMPFNYNRYVQPGEEVFVDFRSSVDQLGNHAGLPGDGRWRMHEVIIQLSEKIAPDSVFWPADYPENTMFWFPTWTGPIEIATGLPYSMWPMEVQPDPRPRYPWDSCAPHPIDLYHEQVATISASAVADYVEVGLILDELEAGLEYTIQWPGDPLTYYSAGGDLRKSLGEPGMIIVTGPDDEVAEYEIPVGWFWCYATFERLVGPSGWCASLEE